MDAFFVAALKAGGRIHGEPTYRDPEREYYSAAVIDFDENSIEVMYRGKAGASAHEQSRSSEDRSVLAWQRDVANSTAENQEHPSVERSTARVYVNNLAKPSVVVTQTIPAATTNDRTAENGSKALLGTLLGAAAGAAVAYAMVKAESLDAKQKAVTQTITYRTVEGQPSVASQIPNHAVYAQSSRHSQSPDGSEITARTPIRAIDYPQQNRSVVSQASRRETASSRHNYAKPTALKQLVAPHKSTVIETHVPPSEGPRYPLIQPITRSQTDGMLSSKAKSHTSRRPKPSRPSSAAETVILVNQQNFTSRPPPSEGLRSAMNHPLPPSKASSIISRRSHSNVPPKNNDYHAEVESLAPCDSISQIDSVSRHSKHGRRSSRQKSEMGAGEGSHVSASTLKGPQSKSRGVKVGSATSLPMRPSSKVSAHRSVKSFVPGM